MVKTDDIVKEARSWIGTPYLHQASLKGVGVDCIGLVRGVARELYGLKPFENMNYTSDWGDSNGKEDLLKAAYNYFTPVPLDQMGPGHIIVLRWKPNRVVKHVMILTGDNRAIHAYNRALTTEIHLNDRWKKRISYAFAFPQEVN